MPTAPSSVATGRVRASAETVNNRQLNRTARRVWRERQREQREEYEREVAVRLVTRYVPLGDLRLIHLDYRYWTLRRAGWDVLKEKYRRPADGCPGCFEEPERCPAWLWWTGLHWQERNRVSKVSRAIRRMA